MKKFLNFLKRHKKLSYFILFLVIVFLVVIYLSRGPVHSPEELKYGITFSKLKARDLGLDWKKAYIDILEDLEIKKIRLAAYWSEVEAQRDNFYYKDLDWQIREASKRDVEIILAVGGRLPRWPECHFPSWSENLTTEKRESEILKYIKNTISRYKDNQNIVAWQVENEPFLSSHFGDCPSLNTDFLDKEISLVKEMDDRPVVVTDSGELSLWIPAATRADIFGTTMYRDTYSGRLERYVHYPIGPGFFQFKRNVTDWFAEPQKWVVIELQAEPWGPVPYQELKKSERERTMSPQKFREMIEFARQTGFQEFYLWGAEYWYWEKVKNGDNSMWKEAKDLFRE